MDELIELWERPVAERIYLIAGWNQWADAGAISSALPQYLIDKMEARKIGEIKPDEFYLFQIPGTHHLLRPEVKLGEGYVQELRPRRNEFFYSGDGEKGLAIFMGEEPHLNEDRYADALFDVIEALGVRRTAVIGGVYGPMPYDQDREVSCVYSLQRMKDELVDYAVKFSNYEGGTTIGTFLADRAEKRGIELLVFNAFVPAYDFSQPSMLLEGLRIENDYKAWYDLMRRFNRMFDLGFDLSDLGQESNDLISTMEEKIEELDHKMPQLKIKEYMEKLAKDFDEKPFMPLDDIWETELGDLFEDPDD